MSVDGFDVEDFRPYYNMVLIGMTALAAIVFVTLFYVNAGYGRFATNKWGFSVSNKVGWVLMEAPAFIFMLSMYFASWIPFPENKTNVTVIVLMSMYLTHYFQRSFIFPLLIHTPGTMPIIISLLAVLFNAFNVTMQGGWLFFFAPRDLYTVDWLYSWNFIVGLVVFIVGMFINCHSDYVIRNLRKPGDRNHYLPEKGFYRYVTSANYFGELIEWTGFAIATWSIAAVVFVIWSFANLGPRAYKIREDYIQKFGADKVSKKRCLFPFIW